MNARTATRLAWIVWGLSVGSVVAGAVLYAVNATGPGGGSNASVFEPAVAVVMPTFGAVIATRRPFHPIAWILLCVSSLGFTFLCGEYATFALNGEPGSPPGGVWAAWVGMWSWAPGIFALNLLLPLLFPSGRLPSRRWKPVLYLVAGLFAFSLLFATVPGPNPEFPSVENPAGIPGFGDAVGRAGGVFGVPFISLTLVCLCAPFVRFRRARGEERQQIKWFVYFSALLAVFLTASAFGLLSGIASDVLNVAMIVCGGTAIGIAILKHRLYDIDFIINKTLVYGALTVSLASIYFAVVASSQYLLRAFVGEDSQITVVASTLVIAALFTPLRRRIQNFIDRRFYRGKYDARKVMDGFALRMRDEVDISDLNEDLVSVVRQTVQPAHASLWLKTARNSKDSQKMSETSSP